jgi:hypothetical protein
MQRQFKRVRRSTISLQTGNTVLNVVVVSDGGALLSHARLFVLLIQTVECIDQSGKLFIIENVRGIGHMCVPCEGVAMS